MTINSFNKLVESDENESSSFFRYLLDAIPDVVYESIKNETNQIKAVVLSYAPLKMAVKVIDMFSESDRADIVSRIATIGRIRTDVLIDINSYIEQEVNNLTFSFSTRENKLGSAADIINYTNFKTRNTIVEKLEKSDNRLAVKIIGKIFCFNDLIKLDKKSLKKIFSNEDQLTVATALKGVEDSVKKTVLSSFSFFTRIKIKHIIKEIGKIRIINIEDAQQKIILRILELDRRGEIIATDIEGTAI
jgi:flagellar motor switch protein FliG